MGGLKPNIGTPHSSLSWVKLSLVDLSGRGELSGSLTIPKPQIFIETYLNRALGLNLEFNRTQTLQIFFWVGSFYGHAHNKQKMMIQFSILLVIVLYLKVK